LTSSPFWCIAQRRFFLYSDYETHLIYALMGCGKINVKYY